MKLIIVVAPSSVIFDQTLPLVASLKKLHPAMEILCLYPNPGSIAGARPDWTPIRMLEELGATSAYPITPFRWMSSKHLSLTGKFPKIIARASRLSFPYLYPMGRFFRALTSAAILILTTVSRFRIARRIETITSGFSCVIWDSATISKKYMEPLRYLLRHLPSYSISHGIGVHSNPAEVDQSLETPDEAISRMTTVFAMSHDDIPYYGATTGIPDERIRATGIYRHHPNWIRAITSQESGNEETEKRDTVLLISRGYSSPNRYLPRDRMLGYLRDIKTITEEHNLRLVIKPHPKEKDLSVYPEVFESTSRGKSWEISDSHLAVLAERAIFAVSFFSGSCLDLTAYGVPTIERLNLVGLPDYDFPGATRDSTGNPVLEYRLHGHVLGSSTSSEFFNRVDQVMRNRKKVMGQLTKAYSRHFITPPTDPETLAQEISSGCREFLDHKSSSLLEPEDTYGSVR